MDTEPHEPYIYQPYGKQEPPYWNSSRIWGIAGVSPLATLRGLTREEAERIVRVLREDSDSDTEGDTMDDSSGRTAKANLRFTRKEDFQ